MIRALVKIGGTVTSLIGSVLFFIFGESLLISSIVFFGPLPTLIIFDVTFTAFSIVIIYVYFKKRQSGNKVILKIEGWVEKKEKQLSESKVRLLRFGKLLGILFFSLTAGPLPTSVLLGVIGYDLKWSIIISVTINFIFFAVWITLYSSGINLFF
ncbi:MAG: hypothetical protein A2898_03090 [Candidatus Kerfeldbacteria bacterium RIFCSPLOWO2_01_FULL_48_11]|uniref:Small multi-drug export protein n=1 Tax=Candidatus Kerfeldbacteria bacterium RIFCSPLOWO2_01_FULL_48_11 TaxID=1798543 RepID=A0A1G2B526_9BACT|nr:MAG: hypothetical protein UY34_C0027G0003 [Parcubacteria group bacterium GW2011_GWA2_48_9]KKW13443.1 MAG: hypothetical protein UY52_C0044G0003 [Parcubacteria group bacterium GW2011_GWC2_49_9]OGY84288.1 MAG: hypothetical protein A2898_03090 [Candidatus Kerfeldbacteria bacterium RIFCSPLOWO2_01_FULL_48_11]HCJ52960.1 hypothetical protein [Candidatus Kerfeldbacteria bacterium]HCM68016.1 hypothetical protein [Candidatus Kerfeldbacteria bacterium]